MSYFSHPELNLLIFRFSVDLQCLVLCGCSSINCTDSRVAADSPECGSGSCVCERQVPTAGRAVSFPLSPSGRSVKCRQKISISTSGLSSPLWLSNINALSFKIPEFSLNYLICWTPVRGMTPGWLCSQRTYQKRLSGNQSNHESVFSVIRRESLKKEHQLTSFCPISCTRMSPTRDFQCSADNRSCRVFLKSRCRCNSCSTNFRYVWLDRSTKNNRDDLKQSRALSTSN